MQSIKQNIRNVTNLNARAYLEDDIKKENISKLENRLKEYSSRQENGGYEKDLATLNTCNTDGETIFDVAFQKYHREPNNENNLKCIKLLYQYAIEANSIFNSNIIGAESRKSAVCYFLDNSEILVGQNNIALPKTTSCISLLESDFPVHYLTQNSMKQFVTQDISELVVTCLEKEETQILNQILKANIIKTKDIDLKNLTIKSSNLNVSMKLLNELLKNDFLANQQNNHNNILNTDEINLLLTKFSDTKLLQQNNKNREKSLYCLQMLISHISYNKEKSWNFSTDFINSIYKAKNNDATANKIWCNMLQIMKEDNIDKENNNKEKSYMQISPEKTTEEILALLNNKNLNHNEVNLFAFIKKGKMQSLSAIIEQGLGDLYAQDQKGNTILHYAIKLGDQKLINSIINSLNHRIENKSLSKNWNIPNKEGITPFILSCGEKSSIDTFNTLLNNLSREDKDKISENTEHLIIAKNNIDKEKLLLQNFQFSDAGFMALKLIKEERYDDLSLMIENLKQSYFTKEIKGCNTNLINYLALKLREIGLEENQEKDKAKSKGLAKIFNGLINREDAADIFNAELKGLNPATIIHNSLYKNTQNNNANIIQNNENPLYQTFSSLIEKNKINLFLTENHNQISVLRSICQAGDTTNLKKLLNADATRGETYDFMNNNANNKSTPLSAAAESLINKFVAEENYSNNIQTIEYLLKQKAIDPNQKEIPDLLTLDDPQINNLITNLAQHPRTKVNQEYTEAKDNSKNFIILSLASKKDQKHAVQTYDQFIKADHHFNLKVQNNAQENAFVVSAICNNSDFLKRIYDRELELLKGQEVQKENKSFFRYFKSQEKTAIENRATTKAIIKLHPVLNNPDNMGRNALYYAAKNGNKDLMEWLIQKNSSLVMQNNENILMALAQQNNNDLFQEYCEKYPELILQKDKHQNTILHYVATNGSSQMLEYLLKNKERFRLNIDAKNKQGITAMMMNSMNTKLQNPTTILNKNKAFLNAEANPNIKDNKGNTALHYAVKYADLNLIQNFAQHPQTDLDIKNKKGITPFAIACYSRKINEKANHNIATSKYSELPKTHNFDFTDSIKQRESIDQKVLNTLIKNGSTPYAKNPNQKEASFWKSLWIVTKIKLTSLFSKKINADSLTSELLNLGNKYELASVIGQSVGNTTGNAIKNMLINKEHKIVKMDKGLQCFIGYRPIKRKTFAFWQKIKLEDEIKNNRHIYDLNDSSKHIFTVEDLKTQIKTFNALDIKNLYEILLERSKVLTIQEKMCSSWNLPKKYEIKKIKKDIESSLKIIQTNISQISSNGEKDNIYIDFSKKEYEKIGQMLLDDKQRKLLIKNIVALQNDLETDNHILNTTGLILSLVNEINQKRIFVEKNDLATQSMQFIKEYEIEKHKQENMNKKGEFLKPNKTMLQTLKTISKYNNQIKSNLSKLDLDYKKLMLNPYHNSVADQQDLKQKQNQEEALKKAQQGFIMNFKDKSYSAMKHGMGFMQRILNKDAIEMSNMLQNTAEKATTIGSVAIMNPQITQSITTLANSTGALNPYFLLTASASYALYKNKERFSDYIKKFVQNKENKEEKIDAYSTLMDKIDATIQDKISQGANKEAVLKTIEKELKDYEKLQHNLIKENNPYSINNISEKEAIKMVQQKEYIKKELNLEQKPIDIISNDEYIKQILMKSKSIEHDKNQSLFI